MQPVRAVTARYGSAADTAQADTGPTKPKSTKGHSRHGAAAFTGAKRVDVRRATLHSGDRCPACNEGRIYRRKEPATLARIVRQAPLEATVSAMQC